MRARTISLGVFTLLAACGEAGNSPSPSSSGAGGSTSAQTSSSGDSATASAGTGGAGVGGSGGAGGSMFPPVASYDGVGPYPTTTADGVGPNGAFTVVRPTALGPGGLLHPVVTWGNGTATPTAQYAPLLGHLASYGFVVIATSSTATGTGQEMLQGVDWLLGENTTKGSDYFGKLDPANVGATGHSQGGGGTINAGFDPRIKTIAPIEPSVGTKAPHGPMLLLCGGLDTVINAVGICGALIYNYSTVPTFFGIQDTATHFTPTAFNGPTNPFMAPVTAWFRYHLMGDQQAKGMFYGDSCSLCADPHWTVQRKNL
jgi:hypothetical protein